MSDPYLSQVELFPFNFAPRGWAQCNGQLLPINQNQALFAVIGTFFGGNGVNNFALPDLRSRAVVGIGQGSGLSNYVIGQAAGTENVSLSSQTTASHTHSVMANPGTTGGTNTPGSSVVLSTGITSTGTTVPIYSSTAPSVTMGQVGQAGTGVPHNNIGPYVGLNYCIALQGVFPTQN
ncbi:MAG TPA: tail fiber protein [Acetobacteraceae bacterium]|nr:tail fiber protein [Acetobacteraceae bacterium]